MNVLAIIPARKGSKGIPGKNIRLLNGIPLLAHSIIHAKKSNLINKIICSTDDRAIADIAINYGAEVPFIRPDELATDTANDAGFTKHAIEFIAKYGNYKADIVVILRPTSPIRDVQIIDKAINKLLDNPDAHSVKTVIRSNVTPFKMWKETDKGYIVPILNSEIFEQYNSARQLLPAVLWQNGYVDVVRADIVLRDNSIHGFKILPLIMNSNDSFDLDSIDDFTKAEKYFENYYK